MFIFIPWKPVAAIWLVLSAMILAGYVVSTLKEGKNPFVPYSIHSKPTHGSGHGGYQHRPA